MGMRKGENFNHPARGSTTTVGPIKEMKDIKSIKKLLADNLRNLCLFILGINTNLRACDLLGIKAGDVKNLKPGDDLRLREKKTGKIRLIPLNKAVVNSIQDLLKSRQYNDDDPLFMGREGPLTVPTVTALVKSWCRAINLNGGNYGAHTLRKTFGYHQRVTFGAGLPELMVCFNHSSQRQTLDYLCVQPEEIKNIYMNEI
jgi:integrase